MTFLLSIWATGKLAFAGVDEEGVSAGGCGRRAAAAEADRENVVWFRCVG